MRARPVGRTGVSDGESSEATSELNHGRREKVRELFGAVFLAPRLNLQRQ